MNNCQRCFGCTAYAALASIIVGVVTAILVATATITLTPVFSIVAFGIAVAALFLTFGVAAFSRENSRECICSSLSVLLTGILGTILASIVILAVGFAATSIVGAIVTGFNAAFFTLMITAFACIISCIVCDCE